MYIFPDFDECISAPCQNSGTCINLDNSFMCNCSSAWEGNLCQFGKFYINKKIIPK